MSELTPVHSHPSLAPSSRRSTGTSGSGLDYYWSNAAGVGPSSSSSSLAVSPSPSHPHMLFIDPSHNHPGRTERLNSTDSVDSDSLLQRPQFSPWSSDSSSYSFSNSPVVPEPEDIEGGGEMNKGGPVQVWQVPMPVHRDSDASGLSGSTARQGLSASSSARPSIASTHTYSSPDPSYHPESMDTPTTATYPASTNVGTGRSRPDLNPPSFDHTYRTLEREHETDSDYHATPTMPQASTPTSGPSPSRYVPGSGRLRTRVDEPQSAPAWKTDFGFGSEFGIPRQAEEGEETIKGRNKRSTLPAVQDYLSPDKAGAEGEGEKGGARGTQSPSASSSPSASARNTRGASPVPPPRSTLRNQFAALSSPVPNLDLYSPPRSYPSSRAASKDDVTHTNTADASSASLNDLAEMLGGAIDEIGLIDSRDTPPPLIGADPRDKPSTSAMASSSSLASSAGTGPASLSALSVSTDALATRDTDAPITPRSLPNRGESLAGPSAPRQVIDVFIPKPWPAAMLFNHIKSLKTPADRAKAYARGINELARNDAGLSEWCALSISAPTRPSKPPASLANYSTHPSSPSIHITHHTHHTPISSNYGSSHPRTVSSGSEFPMRDDHQTAREISQRVIDPAEPTGLPSNLPYPQVQQIKGNGNGNGNLRPSPSTQSMASIASTKRGFFSALRSRKDSGLGPPTAPGALSGNKNIRNLAISHPERSTGISAPLGPRQQRSVEEGQNHGQGQGQGQRGSLELPFRSSIDSARVSARGSVDSARNKVREEDVRAMADVLPHVDKGVLRVYLAKHGDQMGAISAYLEDEKRS